MYAVILRYLSKIFISVFYLLVTAFISVLTHLGKFFSDIRILKFLYSSLFTWSSILHKTLVKARNSFKTEIVVKPKVKSTESNIDTRNGLTKPTTKNFNYTVKQKILIKLNINNKSNMGLITISYSICGHWNFARRPKAYRG